MINSQEAYEYLYNLLELNGDLKWPLCIDSMQIFKDLVDNTTPKKVNCYTFDKHTGTCPRCGITVYHFMNVYCQHCGQKLDWSVNNEKED